MPDNKQPAAPAILKGDEIPNNGTVTVACNVATTGIVLQLYEFEESEEPVLGGGTRVRKVAVAVGDPITIFGTSVAKGVVPRCEILMGYALTKNVDAQFIKKWLKDNAQSPLVKNGCIHAWATNRDNRNWTKENESRRSGLQPIVPGVDDKGRPLDLRVPRRRNTGIGNVGAITQGVAS
jgi:hypothetical protein